MACSARMESTAGGGGPGPLGHRLYPDVEARWQKHWAENKTFATPDLVDTSKPKFYALDMFPYPRCAAYTTPGARRVALLDRCTTRPRPDTLNPLETPRCPSKRPEHTGQISSGQSYLKSMKKCPYLC